MGIKDIKDFSAEEVGLWFAAQGLDPSKIISEGVDGSLLLDLTDEDLKNDLGLSGLQAKKVLKNIEFSKEQFTKVEASGVEETDKLRGDMEAISLEKSSLEEKISELESAMASKDDQIADLKKQMEEMKMENEKSKEVAVEKAAPAPQPAPAPAKHHRGPGVVGGAARGAAGGAMKGAIAGAILPGMDAGDGAKAGAAVGATTGGLRGIRGRRAARRGF